MGRRKMILSMYNKMLFAMNSEDGEIPVDKISTTGIEIFDTKTDTEAHSLLELVLKRKRPYYASLQIINVKQIAQGSILT